MKEIHPQTYLVVPNGDSEDAYQDYWLNKKLLSQLDLRHWPEIFVLHGVATNRRSNGSFTVKFYCWYCKQRSDHYPQEELDIFQSSCSTSDDSGSPCSSILKDMVSIHVEDFGGRFWKFPRSEFWLEPNVNPFRRGAKARVEDAVGSFLYGSNRTIMSNSYDGTHFPKFELIGRHSVFPNKAPTWGAPPSFFYVDRTPAIKFITLEGVYDPDSSYDVYFAPLTPSVWIALGACTCFSFLAEVFLLRGPGHRNGFTLSSLVYELLYWKVASFMGQYKNSAPPSYSHLRPSSGIGICTLVWFIGSIFMLNSYGASFSAESLRRFAFRTTYDKLIDLENLRLYYLLNDCTQVNRVEKGWKIMHKRWKLTMQSACEKYYPRFPECEIIDRTVAARDVYYRREVAASKGDKHKHGASNHLAELKVRVQKWRETLGRLNTNSVALCKDPKAVVKAIEASLPLDGTGAAFIIFDYEFQHAWAMFTEIMKRHPEWKIANNFESSNDDFGIQDRVVTFSGGLHDRYRNRMERRIKVLQGSGILELWRRWERIKVPMSGLRYDDKNIEPTTGLPGDPMSFENSATSWLFKAQSVAWLFAVAIFSVEVIHSPVAKGLKAAVAIPVVSLISEAVGILARGVIGLPQKVLRILWSSPYLSIDNVV